MKPETRIVNAIVRRLRVMRQAGERVWWLKVHGGRFQRAGVPDLIVCWRGAFVGLEAKTPGNEPTPLQRHEMELVRRARGRAEVVCSAEEAIEILKGA